MSSINGKLNNRAMNLLRQRLDPLLQRGSFAPSILSPFIPCTFQQNNTQKKIKVT